MRTERNVNLTLFCLFASACFAACEAPPDRNPPPVGSGGGGRHLPMDDYDLDEGSSGSTGEPATVCDIYFECSSRCGDAEYGNEEMTRDARMACVDSCDAPRIIDSDIESEWGYACANAIGDMMDDIMLCSQGLNLCTIANGG